MKKMINILLMIVCICLSVVTFTACGSENPVETENPVHAVLILQPISTAPVVNVGAAEELLETVCSVPGSSISILVADGKPWEYAFVEPEDIDASFSAKMRKQILAERVEELVAVATSAEAVNEETDLRAAVEMGARELHSYSDDADLEMVICGSFENTVAPIAMQEMALSYMDVEATINNLSADGYVVDLSGIHITGYNLGDTCGEQKELLNKDKIALEEFWTAFFEAGKAEKIDFKKTRPLDSGYEGLPKVSTIPVVEIKSDVQELEIEDIDTVDAIVFDETAIAFKKGTANLADEDAARDAVASVAGYMCQNDIHALLVGGTAKWGNQDDSIKLSFERSQVVKQLLVAQGVPEQNLTVVGTGWLSCFYINDEGEDGELDEEYAPLNRACTWVDCNSELAKKVLSDTDYDKFLIG